MAPYHIGIKTRGGSGHNEMALLKEQKDAVIGDNKTHEGGHRLPRSADRAAERVHQQLDGTPQDPQARQPLAARAAGSGRAATPLLNYLAAKDINRYRALVGKLGIRSRL